MADPGCRLRTFIERFFAATFRFDRSALPGGCPAWTRGLDPEDRNRILWFLRDDLGLEAAAGDAALAGAESPAALLAVLERRAVAAPSGSWPPPAHVGRFLLDGLERSAGTTFLIDGEASWSWPRFHDLACGAARRLRALGLEPGDRVVLHLSNSIRYAATLFGTFLAGGTAVPLHPTSRPAEIRQVLRACSARFLVEESEEAMAALRAEATLLPAPRDERPDERPAWYEPGAAVDPVEPAGPAMILYTSGTTGDPKGVCLSHRALYENTVAILSYLDLHPRDRVLAALPWCFAYGNSVLLTHVRAGASLVNERNTQFPPAVRACLERHAVTGVPGVPPFFATLLSRGGLSREQLPALRYITVAGGALPVPQLEKLRETLPGVVPWVMYGQTEACARLAYVPARELDQHIGSAGRPIAGIELRVLGPEGAFADAGEHGEVLARGTSLMDGYYGDPETSAQTIRDGWLYTGDLGYLGPDGFLYIVDRIKAMLKVDGFRVSPLEVERVISRLEWVEEAQVVVEADQTGKEHLTALVVARPGTSGTEQELRGHCAEELAPFKVPRRVRFVAALPRTAAGKLRRAPQAGG